MSVGVAPAGLVAAGVAARGAMQIRRATSIAAANAHANNGPALARLGVGNPRRVLPPGCQMSLTSLRRPLASSRDRVERRGDGVLSSPAVLYSRPRLASLSNASVAATNISVALSLAASSPPCLSG